ncbi:hypothetical protein [Dolichospermum compactum]|uniref:Uncharacterized protein n=1 Tax=Dolichospermum compactum NIES-806 TaxID=1973481 RepID=A0A1Z4V0F0_9CYAN|nr:hypothetical protein [Dolichospermum compactum]BAZ84785.1 hypothetical protein NIES806_09770 [Dolichospermum compactum NIES-806]
MVYSFILPEETITNFQEKIEFLEKCLNNANPQDEIFAEIIELENSGLISLNKLIEEVKNLQYKLNKFIKFVKALKEKVELDQSSVILFVRYNFLIKEILEQCCEFSVIKHSKEIFMDIIVSTLVVYQKIKKEASSVTYSQHEIYILTETRKHVIQSIIKASVQFKVFPEDFFNPLELEDDITPKESETTLTFLASIKKWDYVYRKLA